ncbi:DMT family transporter [Bacillus alkalicellulosilyticus]|uniref:DMT family transporter n=1 Tax=Alkalihalobacterium alkalicellulosilyticum TaxID=1912214 RepID=UPI0014826B0E|nr:DMT family transporter [Bacillus alkalicellulosilyticus]
MLKPYLLLTLAMLFFSGNFIVGKVFAGTIPPFTLSLLRFSIAIVVLLPFCYRQLFSNLSVWKTHWKSLWSISITGVVLFNVCLYSSVQYTTTINAALVDAMTPTIAAILGYFWIREKLNNFQIIGVGLSFLGTLWIVTRGSFEALVSLSFNPGDLIMLIGICFWAIYSILIKKYGQAFPLLGGLVVTMVLGVIILLPFAIVEWLNGFPFELSVPIVSGLLYIGIFPSALALLFWYKGVDKIGPSKASIFFNLVPIFVTILAFVFLDESITSSQVIGGLLVLSGVYLATFTQKSASVQLKTNERDWDKTS